MSGPRVVLVALLALALGACSEPERNPVPIDQMSAATIPNLSVNHFLTQDMRPGAHTGRLAVQALREVVPPYQAGVHVMQCWPRQMMLDLAREFKNLGYPRSVVHYEDFAL